MLLYITYSLRKKEFHVFLSAYFKNNRYHTCIQGGESHVFMLINAQTGVFFPYIVRERHCLSLLESVSMLFFPARFFSMI